MFTALRMLLRMYVCVHDSYYEQWLRMQNSGHDCVFRTKKSSFHQKVHHVVINESVMEDAVHQKERGSGQEQGKG
jgi:hypothetical protein